jgi:hypothetical protein
MASILSTRSRNWGLAALVALFSIAFTTIAAPVSAEDKPDFAGAGGWEYYKAPAHTQIMVYTTYMGTKNDVTNKNLDLWTGIFTVAAEVKIPGIPIGFFGDVKYQYVGSASNFATGWSDAHLGAKFAFLEVNPVLLSAYIYGTIPMGAKKVKLANFSATNFGLSATIMPISLFAINLWGDFGAVWELQTSAGNLDAVECRFGAELAILTPIVQGRVGITGLYRDKGFDKSAFEFYAEVDLALIPVFRIFLRAGIPIDIKKGLAGLQQGYDTGEILFTGGIWLPLF